MQNQLPLSTETVSAPATRDAAKRGKTFLSYIHNFRGIAIVYIVGAHILLRWPEGSVTHRILTVMFHNSTILFLFISGYLFQHMSDRFEYKSYLRRKFQIVISPYLLLSIPVIAYRVISQDINSYTLADHPDFGTWSAWRQAVYYLLHGAHLQQLWFIPTIAIYYLIAPALMYIDRKPVRYWILAPLVVLSLIVQRDVLSNIPVNAVHFLSVYVLGMFISRYREQFLQFAEKYTTLVTLLPLSFMVLTYYAAERFYDPVEFIQQVLFCGFYIYWLKRLDKYVPRFVATLAALSFGIYYVHYFYVLALRRIQQQLLHHEAPGTLLNWALGMVIVIFLSVWTLQLAHRILGNKSKYLLGY